MSFYFICNMYYFTYCGFSYYEISAAFAKLTDIMVFHRQTPVNIIRLNLTTPAVYSALAFFFLPLLSDQLSQSGTSFKVL
mmetsp:Transcript_35584/g.54721  ORF Transcript_35584/g.54721 Transcript_35584/m.54721 type:complete len:80 (+) Transcript_35584:115-354(+)